MITARKLVAAVEAAFAETGRGLAGWLDPHPDRSPRDEEYSRVTDPHKWRIVGARAEAWLVALADTNLAEIESDTEIQWQAPATTIVTRTDRAVPHAAGALPLVVARSRLDTVDDAGVTLGVGDPAVRLAVIPDCGCDACDSGSQDALDELDEYVFGVVSGAFRRLWRGPREITVISGERWNASGTFGRGEVATRRMAPALRATLAGPGLTEVQGESRGCRPIAGRATRTFCPELGCRARGHRSSEGRHQWATGSLNPVWSPDSASDGDSLTPARSGPGSSTHSQPPGRPS